MRILFAVLLAIAAVGWSLSVAVAQSGASPYEMEERGGLVYRSGESAPYTGLVQDLHQSGQPRLEAHYQGGKLASSKLWYEGGQLAEEVAVAADTWTIRRYQENGRLEEETVAVFRGGRKFSERARLWDEDGKLRSEVGFQGGKLQGPLREFDASGKLVRDEVYDQGVLTQKNK
ncbi:toxin-antitoxin system YwqK family antitoxin [Fundidesulfovibrio soli]|uniref:toxin-antitoxin system YwqK family antitoxin n=1 Tax=Fundidesulfovibrio soli TaxID=2922716 RepID=UPI001FAF7DCA|nr:hypothetical protein [Fundidesulfovibrio soli]